MRISFLLTSYHPSLPLTRLHINVPFVPVSKNKYYIFVRYTSVVSSSTRTSVNLNLRITVAEIDVGPQSPSFGATEVADGLIVQHYNIRIMEKKGEKNYAYHCKK